MSRRWYSFAVALFLSLSTQMFHRALVLHWNWHGFAGASHFGCLCARVLWAWVCLLLFLYVMLHVLMKSVKMCPNTFNLIPLLRMNEALISEVLIEIGDFNAALHVIYCCSLIFSLCSFFVFIFRYWISICSKRLDWVWLREQKTIQHSEQIRNSKWQK